MKRLLLQTNFSKIYAISIILITFFVVSCYLSYALFTVKNERSNAISIVTGNLAYNMKVDNQYVSSLVVEANSNKDFIISLSNPNNRKARFNFYYLNDLPDGVSVGYCEGDNLNVPPIESGINLEKVDSSGSSNTYKIRVINNSDSNVTIPLGVSVGLDYNDLTLPSNAHLFTEFSNELVALQLIPDSTDLTSTSFNTTYLQQLIDDVSNDGGGTVKIPAGIFYFSSNGDNLAEAGSSGSHYAIVCRDNVLVEGAGIDETILKPYGSYIHGLDMFWYIDHDTFKYLENADFKNFTIDGIDATSTSDTFNAHGKGFMTAPVKNCDWEYVKVENTDGTGFGMDLPVNCSIKNCIAIGNGKAASETDAGASGFGIGFGYSEDESMYISNCTSIGNRKYGYFFEHQGRFLNPNISAKKAEGSNEPNSDITGFVVENSVSRGNLYDYGGAKSNDVTYKNCRSEISKTDDPNPLGNSNKAAFYFELNSRRTFLIDNTVEYEFSDVSRTDSYYEAVKWGVNQNVVDIGARTTTFNPNNYVVRAEVVAMMWKMSSRTPGDVLLMGDEVQTGYIDVPNTIWYNAAWYADAVAWGKEVGVLSSGSQYFNPTDNCSRADFILMLYRLAGEPSISIDAGFSDVTSGAYYYDAVNWAYSKGIIDKPSSGLFNPVGFYTRGEAIEILYNYYNN